MFQLQASSQMPRSQTGCHTCRLRKKKCDELHPICRNCLDRNIPCYGYGVKPAWIDDRGVSGRGGRGGEGEGDFVRAIKKAAERNYRARRRGLIPSGIGGDFCGVSEEISAGVVEGVVMGREGKENSFAPDCEEWEQGWDALMSPGTGADQAILWDGGLDMSSHDLGMVEGYFSLSPADTAPLSLRLKASDDDEETAIDSKMMFSSRAGSHQSSRLPTEVGNIPQHSTRSSHFPSSHSLDSIWWQSNFASNYNVRNKADLGLLTHYLDNVFGLQFGFSGLRRLHSQNFKHSWSPLEKWQASQASSIRLHSPSRISIGGANSESLDRGRGWYLNALLKCRPLYFATLSISAWHQHLVRLGDISVGWASANSAGKDSANLPNEGHKMGSGLNWEAERNFVMTLKGLQGVLDELNMQGLRGVELLRTRWMVLGTMCQVLSLEVFRTLGGNWPIHIRAARTFLSMIGSSSFSPSSSSPAPKSSSPGGLSRPPRPRSASKYIQHRPDAPPRLDILENVLTDDKHSILTPDDTAALKHFVTIFIWVDILSHASGLHPSPVTGLPVSQAFDYLPLLENGKLDLSRVMGCENWVFIGIAQMVLLEDALVLQHGEEHQLTGTRDDPNGLDLHSRAAVLEAMLERGIRDLLEARANGRVKVRGNMSSGGVGGGEMTDLELQSNLVTELFALSALTYLHVTTSGAYPFLLDARSSVRRSLEALESLPPELLIRVSWPFTVTGCMVLEEQRERIRSVVRRAVAEGSNVGTVWKGMVVVEECWRLRDLGEASGVGVEVSWAQAMESLGEMILLC